VIVTGPPAELRQVPIDDHRRERVPGQPAASRIARSSGRCSS
jgi:hypothetical protein